MVITKQKLSFAFIGQDREIDAIPLAEVYFVLISFRFFVAVLRKVYFCYDFAGGVY